MSKEHDAAIEKLKQSHANEIDIIAKQMDNEK